MKLMSRFFRCVIVIQFLFCQWLYASELNYSVNERMHLAANVGNWSTAFKIVGVSATDNEISPVANQLKNNGINLKSKMNFIEKNGSLYIGKNAVIVSGDGITFRGVSYKYDFSKTYSDNYLDFYKKLQNASGLSHHSDFFNLMSVAQADESQKSSNAKEFAGTAATLTFLAFLFGAPTWVIASGVAITVLFASLAVAYADEMDSNVTNIKNFSCVSNGWQFSLKNGTVVTTTKDTDGKVWVEQVGKSGAIKAQASTAQADLFLANMKICKAKNSDVVKTMSDKFSTTSNSGGAEGSSTKTDSTK